METYNYLTTIGKDAIKLSEYLLSNSFPFILKSAIVDGEQIIRIAVTSPGMDGIGAIGKFIDDYALTFHSIMSVDPDEECGEELENLKKEISKIADERDYYRDHLLRKDDKVTALKDRIKAVATIMEAMCE